MSQEFDNLLLPEVSYRHLVTDHPLHVFEIDAAGTILFANRLDDALTDQWQTGRNLFGPLNPQDRKSLERAIALIGQGASAAHCQIGLAHKTGGGMRLLVQLGPIRDNNAINRMLLVFKPIQTSRSRQPNDIANPMAIRAHLLSALLSNETIDIQIENVDESFNTLLLPFPPQAEGKLSPSYDTDFLPGGYMSTMTHLLLCPLEPSFGNIRIRKAGEVTMTFYEEAAAYHGVIHFQGVLQGKDGMALKTSFPQLLSPFQRRLTKRVKVPVGVNVKLIISVDQGPTLETLLGDISANGLSFYYPVGVEPLPPNTEITLTLHVGGSRSLEVFGVVCNAFTARDGGNPYRLRKKGGVEYYPLSDDDENERLTRFIDKLDKNFKLFLDNKQRKYSFDEV